MFLFIYLEKYLLISFIYVDLLFNLLGACGKSERSLEMIAGGNGEAIGKVSTLSSFSHTNYLFFFIISGLGWLTLVSDFQTNGKPSVEPQS